MNTSNLRISSAKQEGSYQASKWLSVQVLLDASEMNLLLQVLGDFFIYQAGSICKVTEGLISKESFLEIYADYVRTLKDGKLPDDSLFRSMFSSIFTRTTDLLYTIPFEHDRHLIRVTKPVVQLQAHRMHYSAEDGLFRPMIFGPEGISWGIQFSYPQIFQDNQTHEIQQVFESGRFSNTELFRTLQRWIRHHTVPTPFLADGKRTNTPMRLGKECLAWINQHPQLIQKGLRVVL